MVEVEEQKPDKPQVDYQKWGSRAQWVSAIATASGVVVAMCAMFVAWTYYQASVAQQKNKLSADALLAWSGQQPPNTRPCLDLLGKLKTEELEKIIRREGFSLSLRGKDASLVDEAKACFSDQDENIKLLKDDDLTPRGASLIASRANAILEADSFIANFLLKKILNPEIFDRVRDLICRDDVLIINNLPTDPRTLDGFAPLRELIRTPHPGGCGDKP
jgi:hypothetical protein